MKEKRGYEVCGNYCYSISFFDFYLRQKLNQLALEIDIVFIVFNYSLRTNRTLLDRI